MIYFVQDVAHKTVKIFNCQSTKNFDQTLNSYLLFLK